MVSYLVSPEQYLRESDTHTQELALLGGGLGLVPIGMSLLALGLKHGSLEGTVFDVAFVGFRLRRTSFGAAVEPFARVSCAVQWLDPQRAYVVVQHVRYRTVGITAIVVYDPGPPLDDDQSRAASAQFRVRVPGKDQYQHMRLTHLGDEARVVLRSWMQD